MALNVVQASANDLSVSLRMDPGSRLIATGGATQLEGAGGGGIVPWAVITGYAAHGEWGGTAFRTDIAIDDFNLQSIGLALAASDRLELSIARQRFGAGDTVPGEVIRQDIVGFKLRLLGDAIYDQDRWWPQLALGVQHKRNRDFQLIPKALGAKHDHGLDVYLAATKVHLAGLFGRNWLWNVTLRGTRANQMGILGFGGDRRDRMQWLPEVSMAVLLTDQLAVGGEYRRKPNNLSVYEEDAYSDGFISWWPSKQISFTVARARLGNVADKPNQRGWYLSTQLAF
ncbi:DUF3034 family protein [Chitinivorax sp. B]|uniref:DUF3034 family protein n=1 Tax=Chitinivorax sp. B TaxID=2502235 RepID=UPI00201757C8|nr:DUF3034 family protein [Chitinivorax sp. B]